MKIRQGFVSNSSSSSFVVRGVRLKIKDAAKRVGVDPESEYLFDDLYNKFGYGKGVSIQSAMYYFSDDQDYNKQDVIVGCKIVDLDDGHVVAIPDVKDDVIRKEIEDKIGDIEDMHLKTYIQFVSNDNF